MEEESPQATHESTVPGSISVSHTGTPCGTPSDSSLPSMKNSQSYFSTQDEKDSLERITFNIEETQEDDKESDVMHMANVTNRVIERYLCERFAPKLLPNPLHNHSIVELRYSTTQALTQLHQMRSTNTYCPETFLLVGVPWFSAKPYLLGSDDVHVSGSRFSSVTYDVEPPSLHPRDRIQFLANSQALHRALYTLQSFVLLRLTKMLSDPFRALRSSTVPEGMDRTPLLGRSPGDDPSTTHNRTSRPINTKRPEEEALNILERAFLQELSQLLQTFSLSVPQTESPQLVHAQVLSHLPPVPLDALNLPTMSSGMLDTITASSTCIDSTQDLASSSASYGRMSGHLASGTVLTLNYDAVQHLVEDGHLGLTG